MTNHQEQTHLYQLQIKVRVKGTMKGDDQRLQYFDDVVTVCANMADQIATDSWVGPSIFTVLGDDEFFIYHMIEGGYKEGARLELLITTFDDEQSVEFFNTAEIGATFDGYIDLEVLSIREIDFE